MSQESHVCLSIASYNQIKAENTKFNMFITRLMESSTLSKDKAGIEFDTKLFSELMRLVYPEAYKKRLSWLRGQDTKKAMEALKQEEINNDGI